MNGSDPLNSFRGLEKLAPRARSNANARAAVNLPAIFIAAIGDCVSPIWSVVLVLVFYTLLECSKRCQVEGLHHHPSPSVILGER